MVVIEYAENYEDMSTGQGYQFNFLCNRCGNAYQSNFIPSNVGVAGGLLRAASGLLNKGAVGKIPPSVFTSPAHAKALQSAIEEMRSRFIQCPKCHLWVCTEICWNEDAQVCKNCAPVPGEAEARERMLTPREPSFLRELEREREREVERELEREREMERERELAEEAEADVEEPIAEVKELLPVTRNGTKPHAGGYVNCPDCGTLVADGKFCSNCGASLKTTCVQCGHKLTPGVKFCSDCGTKV